MLMNVSIYKTLIDIIILIPKWILAFFILNLLSIMFLIFCRVWNCFILTINMRAILMLIINSLNIFAEYHLLIININKLNLIRI